MSNRSRPPRVTDDSGCRGDGSKPRLLTLDGEGKISKAKPSVKQELTEVFTEYDCRHRPYNVLHNISRHESNRQADAKGEAESSIFTDTGVETTLPNPSLGSRPGPALGQHDADGYNIQTAMHLRCETYSCPSQTHRKRKLRLPWSSRYFNISEDSEDQSHNCRDRSMWVRQTQPVNSR
ncbi:hypothetical protein BDV96DRAFT_669098 [Lophiotrema nucula]|uniref:Uncharacterized protein n=1 Tax=Lophiotrema nucula TaxID=690887 RepID=A0A6A5YTE2_9PLEO|nr:hypothetical protein BDV96DRAFT_669098 [Lophiotrema nucula]